MVSGETERERGGVRLVVIGVMEKLCTWCLTQFPSIPCIINSFLGLRFMKSPRYVSQSAWHLLLGKESKWKDARVNIGKG